MTSKASTSAEPQKAPSVRRQKAFIVENTGILDRATKMSILGIVMMEVGLTSTVVLESGEKAQRAVVIENKTSKEVSLNLDNIGNSEVILHIYNIVCNRRDALSKPLRGPRKKTSIRMGIQMKN